MGVLREEFKYMMNNTTIDNIYLSDIRLYKDNFTNSEILNLYKSTQKNYHISTNLNHNQSLNYFNVTDGVKEINIGNYYKCVSGSNIPKLYTGLTYKRIFNNIDNHSVFFMGYSYDDINTLTNNAINNTDIATLNIKGNKFDDDTKYKLLYSEEYFKDDIRYVDLGINPKEESIPSFIKNDINENVSLNCEDLIISKGYLVSSDKRLKYLINDISMNDIKDNYRKISLKLFKFKDRIKYGNKPKLGLIADQVESLFPFLVKKTNGFIPNIYRLCEYRYDSSALKIYLKNEELEIFDGDKVRYY